MILYIHLFSSKNYQIKERVDVQKFSIRYKISKARRRSKYTTPIAVRIKFNSKWKHKQIQTPTQHHLP